MNTTQKKMMIKEKEQESISRYGDE